MPVMRLRFALALMLTISSPVIAAPKGPQRGPEGSEPFRVPLPAPRAVAGGTSLATTTGTRLFPRLVGEPMPGWLGAYGGDEMSTAYEGYHEEATLPGGSRLVLMRSQALVGAYVLQGDRCVGELLFEPMDVEMPETLATRLHRAGFHTRTGLLATRDRGYGVTATIYERRQGPSTEQYFLFDLPQRVDGVLRVRTVVGAEAYFPTRLAGALAPAIAKGTAALVDFCRLEEEKSRKSAF
jgi:hypothetical protein